MPLTLWSVLIITCMPYIFIIYILSLKTYLLYTKCKKKSTNIFIPTVIIEKLIIDLDVYFDKNGE